MFDHTDKKPSHQYPAQFNDYWGSIKVYDEGIVIFTKTNQISIRNGYVDSLRKSGEVILGKINVEISYYDMFGNKQKLEALMRESDFAALRADLNKIG